MGGVEEGALTRGTVTDRAAAAFEFVFGTRRKLLLPSREEKKEKPVSPAGVSQFAGSRFGRLMPKKVCRVQLKKPGLRATLMFRKSRRITAVNPQACAPNVSLIQAALRVTTEINPLLCLGRPERTEPGNQFSCRSKFMFLHSNQNCCFVFLNFEIAVQLELPSKALSISVVCKR